MNQRSNILIFPLIKKIDDEIDEEEVDVEKIRKISKHYVNEILENLKLHNVNVNRQFSTDCNIVEEMLVSAIMRSCGKHHIMQDLVDSLLTDENGEVK